MFNLKQYVLAGCSSANKEDRPAWEMDDPFKPIRSVPFGYLDYLTWQTRQIQLIPEVLSEQVVVKQMITIPGLSLDNEFTNPMYFYFHSENTGKKFLRFRESRALWRDSADLLQFREDNYIAPACIGWAAQLKEAGLLEKHYFKLTALGAFTDPGKQKVYSYREEQLPFPAILLTDSMLLQRLIVGINQAEEASRVLWAAVNTMAKLLISPESDLMDSQPKTNIARIKNLHQHLGGEVFYWNRLEKLFNQFVQSLSVDQIAASNDWTEAVYEIAWQAFRHTAQICGNEAKALKAQVRGTGLLAKGLNEIFKLEMDKKSDQSFPQQPFITAVMSGKKTVDPTILLTATDWRSRATTVWKLERYKYIATHVSETDYGTWREDIYYLIAGLFAFHPRNIGRGNMGHHFRLMGPYGSVQEKLTEKYFVRLLSSGIDNLPMQMQKAVGLFKNNHIWVNWNELFVDLLHWDAADQQVQRKWANAFWGYKTSFEKVKFAASASPLVDQQGEKDVL
jgi:CRISPR type I-E-associated protein CasB/Cse2